MTGFWDDVFNTRGRSGACNTFNRVGGYRVIPSREQDRGDAPLLPLSPHGDEANHLAENLPGGDDYATMERAAIVWESEQPPEPPAPEVPGFGDLPNLTPSEHGAILHRLLNPAQEPPATARAPERVTCAACAEFEPGPQPEGLGRCSRTADGLPPVASRGYGCCFPHAPRTCPDFKEILK